MSVPAVTRIDFQQLADVRIDEALTLLGLGRWDGAYYLAGYAVEMALNSTDADSRCSGGRRERGQ